MFTRSGLHAYILTQSSNHARLVPVKLREIVRYKKVKTCYCNQVTKYPKMRSRGVVKKKRKKREKKGPNSSRSMIIRTHLLLPSRRDAVG